MRPRRSVNDRHKWSRFGSPFPFRANNKGGEKNRKIGEMDVAKSYVARRLPAVPSFPSPQIHQRGSSITLLNQKTRIVSRICEHRGGGRGGLAASLFFSPVWRFLASEWIDRLTSRSSSSYNLQNYENSSYLFPIRDTFFSNSISILSSNALL